MSNRMITEKAAPRHAAVCGEFQATVKIACDLVPGGRWDATDELLRREVICIAYGPDPISNQLHGYGLS